VEEGKRERTYLGMVANIAERCRLIHEVQIDRWIVAQTESDNVIFLRLCKGRCTSDQSHTVLDAEH
jgi:hypothetical protein